MLVGEARKPEQCEPGLLRGWGSRNPSSKVVFVAARLSETNKCHLFISDSRVASRPITFGFVSKRPALAGTVHCVDARHSAQDIFFAFSTFKTDEHIGRVPILIIEGALCKLLPPFVKLASFTVLNLESLAVVP